MISLDHLVCRAYSSQALKRRSVKIQRSQSRLPPTPATGMQPEDHRNALDRKVLQKTPVGYGAIANVPQVPQVHQSCVRTDLSTVRHPSQNQTVASTRTRTISSTSINTSLILLFASLAMSQLVPFQRARRSSRRTSSEICTPQIWFSATCQRSTPTSFSNSESAQRWINLCA
jgi:hypothetical protein